VPDVAAQQLAEPVVTCIQESQLVAPPAEVARLDLSKVSIGELSELGGCCRFKAQRSAIVHGWALWFTCHFAPTNVVLSTSPASPQTHWKQSVVLLPEVRRRCHPWTQPGLALMR
jgi:hypothetical protein